MSVPDVLTYHTRLIVFSTTTHDGFLSALNAALDKQDSEEATPDRKANSRALIEKADAMLAIHRQADEHISAAFNDNQDSTSLRQAQVKDREHLKKVLNAGKRVKEREILGVKQRVGGEVGKLAEEKFGAAVGKERDIVGEREGMLGGVERGVRRIARGLD